MEASKRAVPTEVIRRKALDSNERGHLGCTFQRDSRARSRRDLERQGPRRVATVLSAAERELGDTMRMTFVYRNKVHNNASRHKRDPHCSHLHTNIRANALDWNVSDEIAIRHIWI
jgi:hypothetical protein